MEFIKRENNIYITRYYPSKNPRIKYKKGDVIHNYDHFKCVNNYNIAYIIEYGYKRFYFIIVSTDIYKRKIVDNFDIIYCSRDEAIDRFLDYCKEKNYKICFEIN